jgi:hypothetical protein
MNNWPTEEEFIEGYSWVILGDRIIREEDMTEDEPTPDGSILLRHIGSAMFGDRIGVWGVLHNSGCRLVIQLPKPERNKLIEEWPDWIKRAFKVMDEEWEKDAPEIVEDWNLNYADRWKQARA